MSGADVTGGHRKGGLLFRGRSQVTLIRAGHAVGQKKKALRPTIFHIPEYAKEFF